MFLAKLYLASSDFVEIKLQTGNPQEISPIIIEGNSDEATKAWLSQQMGVFGLFIEESTTALDLEFALQNQTDYKVEIIESSSGRFSIADNLVS